MGTDYSESENRPGLAEHQLSQAQVTAFILEPSKVMAYETGYTLHSYTLRSEEPGWLLVIRVNALKGGRLVTFIKADSIYTCYELWLTAMTSKALTLRWYPDKFQ